MLLYLYWPVRSNAPVTRFIYGIEGQSIDMEGHVVERVCAFDISVNASFVMQLARRCTVGQLSIDHFMDVINDAIHERNHDLIQ